MVRPPTTVLLYIYGVAWGVADEKGEVIPALVRR